MRGWGRGITLPRLVSGQRTRAQIAERGLSSPQHRSNADLHPIRSPVVREELPADWKVRAPSTVTDRLHERLREIAKSTPLHRPRPRHRAGSGLCNYDYHDGEGDLINPPSSDAPYTASRLTSSGHQIAFERVADRRVRLSVRTRPSQG